MKKLYLLNLIHSKHKEEEEEEKLTKDDLIILKRGCIEVKRVSLDKHNQMHYNTKDLLLLFHFDARNAKTIIT